MSLEILNSDIEFYKGNLKLESPSFRGSPIRIRISKQQHRLLTTSGVQVPLCSHQLEATINPDRSVTLAYKISNPPLYRHH